jgi:hypothetical protein
MINNPVSVILIQRLDNNGHGNRYGVFYKENMVNLDLIPKRLLEKIVTDKKLGAGIGSPVKTIVAMEKHLFVESKTFLIGYFGK